MLGPMSLQIHRASLRAFPHFSSARVHAFGLALGLSTGLDFVSSQMMAVAGQHIQGGVHADPQAYLYAVTAYAVAAVVTCVQTSLLLNGMRPHWLILPC